MPAAKKVVFNHPILGQKRCRRTRLSHCFRHKHRPRQANQDEELVRFTTPPTFIENEVIIKNIQKIVRYFRNFVCLLRICNYFFQRRF